MLRDRGLRRTSPELTAESLLRGAHASAVLDGLGVDARRGARRVRRRDRPRRRCGSRSSCSGWCPVLLRARRCRRWPGCTRWRRPARCPTTSSAGRGTPRRPRGCATSLGLLGARATGAGDRGAGARRAGDRRAVRVGQRAGRAGRRAAGAGQQRGRREVAGRAGGRPPRPAAGVRVEPAGRTPTAAAPGSTPGCCTAPRRTPRAPRRARCGGRRPDESGAPDMRAAPDSRSRVPPLTRETRLPSVHLSNAAPGVSR